MSGSCVKGYIVASAAERVRAALDQARIHRDQVEDVLGAHSAVVDEEIDPFRWYSVKILEALNLLLAKAKGGNPRDAMVALGEEQFEELAAMGVHQQLGFSEGELSQASPEEIGRWGRLVSTLVQSVYNFSEMGFEADPELPGRYNLDWRGIGDLGDIVVESTLGFIGALARRAAGPAARVTLERPAPGQARYVFEPAAGARSTRS